MGKGSSKLRAPARREGLDACMAVKDRPTPKVFSLVGKSADEVRGMSGQVSQEGTGTEERVALNRVMRAPLEV